MIADVACVDPGWHGSSSRGIYVSDLHRLHGLRSQAHRTKSPHVQTAKTGAIETRTVTGTAIENGSENGTADATGTATPNVGALARPVFEEAVRLVVTTKPTATPRAGTTVSVNARTATPAVIDVVGTVAGRGTEASRAGIRDETTMIGTCGGKGTETPIETLIETATAPRTSCEGLVGTVMARAWETVGGRGRRARSRRRGRSRRPTSRTSSLYSSGRGE